MKRGARVRQSVVSRTPIPFARPAIGDSEASEVLATLASGWLTTGPRVQRFEREFGAWVGAQHALAVNSCTAALHLSLLAAGIGAGDEVITTPLTFCATANAIIHTGARPVFADIDRRTYNLDPSAVERAITPRTRAILPVHYAGRPADVLAFQRLSEAHGLVLIEDAAHAVEAVSNAGRVGTTAHFTCFSFYATKNLTTGEGGMVTTASDRAATWIRTAALHGMSRDAFDRFTAKVPSWYYEIVAPGFKYNLTDIAAALGIHQLRRAHAFAQRREQLAAQYAAALDGLPVLLPPQPARGDRHAWHLYVLQLADGAAIGRDALIERLFAAGIGCSVHYIPLHLQPYWRDRYALRPEAFPHSQRAFERMLSLPLYTRMTDADVGRVAATVRAALG